jgi:hypothetical protein
VHTITHKESIPSSHIYKVHQNTFRNARFEVLAVVLLKIYIFWGVTLSRGCVFLYFFKDHSGFIFRVKHSKKNRPSHRHPTGSPPSLANTTCINHILSDMTILFGLLDLGYKGTKILRSVGELHPSTQHHIPENFESWYTHKSH